MLDKMEEPITVAAVFGQKPLIKPVWFVWRGNRYTVLNTTYSWTDKEGCVKRYHFAVTDGSNLYELCYNSERLNWQLLGVDIEGR